MARRSPSPRPKRFALYWCATADGNEDWFVVSATARAARVFHEDAEGYDRGDASAERVVALPGELHVSGGWKDGPAGEIRHGPGWPSDELLVACGAEIAPLPRNPLHREMGAVCKDVRFGDRVFRAGDIVENVGRRVFGAKGARLSVFEGGRRS